MKNNTSRNQLKEQVIQQNFIKFFDLEMESLAQHYGDNYRNRVESLISHAFSYYKEQSLQNNSYKIKFLEMRWVFLMSFKEAIKFLSPQKAIRLFESNDPHLLVERASTVNFFNEPYIPFYTLEELANFTEEILHHIEINRDSLIKIGFPKTGFARSKWLDHTMNRLFFVKLPVCIQSHRLPWHQQHAEEYGSAEKDPHGNPIHNYSWIDKCPLSEDLFYGKQWWVINDQNGLYLPAISLDFCDYEKASLIQGLPKDIARYLEQNREVFFKLKANVIAGILDFLRSPKGCKDIVTRCLHTLTELITKEQMKFALDVDELYAKLGVADYLDQLYNRNKVTGRPWGWGGMIDLLSIICHYDEELRIGIDHKTKSKIIKELSEPEGLQSYYQIIGKSMQAEIERILDSYDGLLEEGRKHWKNFLGRVDNVLRTEFMTRFSVSELIKAKHEEDFKSLWNWLYTYTSETDKFPSIELKAEIKETPKKLSRKQEKDYEKFEYKCHDQVHITGTRPKDRSNLVEVNGHRVKIPDRYFRLFLRFVLELKKKQGGWVHKAVLSSEGIIPDIDGYQFYSQLRIRFEERLLDRDGKRFIENDGSGNYRISVHPDRITYDKQKLINHPEPEIVKLVKQLP